jgi:RHS repeat-associated protein
VEQNFAFTTGLWTGFDQKLFTGGVKTVTRTNDTFFRLTNVALTGLTGTLDYGYDDDGLVINVGGLVATRGNTAGMLKRLQRSSTQEDENFVYDQYGALKQMNALYGTGPTAGRGGLALTYDAISGRILTKTESWTWFGTPAKTWTYTYDTSGRLASSSQGGTTVTYTYDTNGNRLPSIPDAQDRVLSQSGTTYTYDNHGNVTTRKVGSQLTQTLTWNGQGGLLSVVQSGSPTVTYVIDPQGRRVGRKVGANLDREWLYDTQLRLVGEVIGSTSRVYGYLPERHLPVMMRETKSGITTTYRIYGDHLGSLRAVVKSADGTPVQLMQHDAWGNVLIDTVAAGFDRVPFGFAGGQYDENTKLVRFGAREYDATTGRWLSKDEARFGGGWNFYEYAGSDPVNWVDLDGTRPVKPGGGEREQGYRGPPPRTPLPLEVTLCMRFNRAYSVAREICCTLTCSHSYGSYGAAYQDCLDECSPPKPPSPPPVCPTK